MVRLFVLGTILTFHSDTSKDDTTMELFIEIASYRIWKSILSVGNFSARNLEEIINPFHRILYGGKIKYNNSKWIFNFNNDSINNNFRMLEVLFGIIGIEWRVINHFRVASMDCGIIGQWLITFHLPNIGFPRCVAKPPSVSTCEWSAVTTRSVSDKSTSFITALTASSKANVSSNAR